MPTWHLFIKNTQAAPQIMCGTCGGPRAHESREACAQNVPAQVFLLAHCGVAADTMRPDGWSAAAAAASRGHLAALKVLRAHGGRLDVPSLDGATPLWCASQEGFVDGVECVPSRCSGRTPLHHEPRADGEGAA